MTTEENFGFRFQEWNAYKDGRSFRSKLNALLQRFPPEEKYALVDQTRRALNSVLLNLAEGANKNTDRETRVYINRAQGSVDEVVACLDCALDDHYINEGEHSTFLEGARNLAKQLRAFSAHLKS
ncbi:MAG: hypothetical protein A3A27_03010 [Candidatus Wildermuthbacteria bacterium RIFCSPLOWO2_01_FULL_47_18]|uniref:Four helix bundle protein n=2 Tax=Candidatus Wildermuthiibacteriota TaxID=1817923 RepID=A0A1G2RGM1_9BACT|nr:MAG: hypothetical protein A3J68_02435 [Candidatus Wildermuthbacteria bacterium RIFCSPHIGHO2_02_FULL_48_16]OHA71980.1 MAG: hypothetical protein A3A27_03010 [Candidatus Wildermuthbacteria bacterium RIFCSPLOWO2_01_FULL_47_18]